MSPRRPVIAIGLTLAAVVLVSAPASAAPIPPRSIAINGESTLSVQYGQGWYFSFDAGCYRWDTYTVTNGTKAFSTGTGYGSQGGNFGSFEAAPLPVGTNKLSLSLTTPCGTETVPVQVKVAEAPLTLDARVVADPNAASNAIVSVTAKGDFVDRLIPAAFRDPDSARFPSGTWAVTVTGQDDTVAYQKKFSTAVGDPEYVTAYWIDTPADQKLTVKATFTPSGSTAADFAVVQPAPFDFTTSDRPGPGLSKPADDGPPAGVAPTGFTLPLWSLIVGGVLALLAIVFGALGAVRLRRRLRTLDELRSERAGVVSRARA